MENNRGKRNEEQPAVWCRLGLRDAARPVRYLICMVLLFALIALAVFRLFPASLGQGGGLSVLPEGLAEFVQMALMSLRLLASALVSLVLLNPVLGIIRLIHRRGRYHMSVYPEETKHTGGTGHSEETGRSSGTGHSGGTEHTGQTQSDGARILPFTRDGHRSRGRNRAKNRP